MPTSLGNPLENEVIQLPVNPLEVKELDFDFEVVIDEQPSRITGPRKKKYVYLTQKTLNQQIIAFPHS
jgi:hypothetical protein